MRPTWWLETVQDGSDVVWKIPEASSVLRYT
jgi:hypothetical protein